MSNFFVYDSGFTFAVFKFSSPRTSPIFFVNISRRMLSSYLRHAYKVLFIIIEFIVDEFELPVELDYPEAFKDFWS